MFITPNFLARKPQKIWFNTFHSSKFNVQESSPNPLHFAYPPVINHGTLKSPTKTDDFPNQNLYFVPGFPRFSQDLPIVFPLKPSFSGRQKLCHHVDRSPRRSPVVASDFDQAVATRRCWNLQEPTVFNGKAMEHMERHVTLMLTHGGFLN